MASLTKLIVRCDYEPQFQTVLLRDRFVCGLSNESTRKRLLTEEDTLTLERALEIAISVEKATVHAKQMKSDIKSTSVYQLNSKHQNKPSQFPTCHRCGGPHLAPACRFINEKCQSCGKTGHIAKVCRSKPSTSNRQDQHKKSYRTHSLEVANLSDTSANTSPPIYNMFSLNSRAEPIMVPVNINNRKIEMELDTDAAVSVISETTFNHALLSESTTLQPSSIILRTYLGKELPILGTVEVNVEYESQNETLSLLVIKGQGASLFGRDWLKHFRLNWSSINSIDKDKVEDEIIQKHSPLFRSELGTLQGGEAKIFIPQNTQPRFFKPRPVAYALKDKVEQELSRLQKEGVITPVQFSDWAAPIVPVIKSDGSIRICGDYSVTVNAVSKLDSYPLPRVDDLFTAMSGGKLFTKLDLSHAYQQLPLAEESKKYTTINTTKGLFQYERLPFGISSAPAIFQRTMDRQSTTRSPRSSCLY